MNKGMRKTIIIRESGIQYLYHFPEVSTSIGLSARRMTPLVVPHIMDSPYPTSFTLELVYGSISIGITHRPYLRQMRQGSRIVCAEEGVGG